MRPLSGLFVNLIFSCKQINIFLLYMGQVYNTLAHIYMGILFDNSKLINDEKSHAMVDHAHFCVNIKLQIGRHY